MVIENQNKKMENKMKIGCVILAGGKSSRMGQDKALLEIEGKSFIEFISDEMSFFEEKLIARGNQNKISNSSWRIIPDIYLECGPIGGLHAALSVCDSDALCCVACDMPFVKRALTERLCEALQENYDAIVVKEKNGKVHPLYGVYRKATAEIFKMQILSGNNRIMTALEKMRVKYIVLEDKEVHQLRNVNTPEDYSKIQ